MILPLSYNTLVGRGNGAIMDQDLRRLLATERCLMLDFSAVHMMDGVFADAAFGMLAEDRCRGVFTGGALVFANMNSDVMRNLGMALICRAAETSVRNCVALSLDAQGHFYLVGKSEANVSEAWRWLQACPSLTATGLADKLNLSPSAASNRLKWLYDLGLCLREEERTETGRQFIYRRIDQEEIL
jgi:DNA-binding transcriptional ArsR family regulator